MADAKLDEQIEDVAELSPDILAGELNAAYPDQLPAHWRPAAERPKRWLRRYVEVLRAAYGAYEPLWSSKRALFDREAERVGVAAVRGYVAELADTLSPLVRVDGQHLRLPGNAAERVRMTGRSLVLCPMVAGPKALAYNLGAAGQVWLAYPLSGLGDNLRTTASTTGMDYLATLLGTVRARLLALIDRPCNAGQLATAMNCSPSVITHHCDRLEAAGLVSRERRGREIRVERTARGEQLLDLYVHEHLTIC